jgi:hypothetical protein
MAKRTTVKTTEKTPRIMIDKSSLDAVISFINQDINVLYEALGTQISQVESPKLALIQTAKRQGLDFAISLPNVFVNFKSKAYAFIRRYWPKLKNVVCPWWNKNKDSEDTKSFLKKLALLIVPLLPPPFNHVQGIPLLVAGIIIKYGLDTVCKQQRFSPPSPK